jgi:hypothetical protein
MADGGKKKKNEKKWFNNGNFFPFGVVLETVIKDAFFGGYSGW